MKSLIILLAIFLSATHAFAQEPVWSKKYHTGSVTCLDFSGDGGKLLSGGMDKKVVIWDIAKQDSLKAVIFKNAVQSVDSYDNDLLLISTNSWNGFRTGSNENYLLKLSDSTYKKEIKGKTVFQGSGLDEINENIAFFRNNEIIAVNSGVYSGPDPTRFSFTMINTFSLDSLILKRTARYEEFDIELYSTSISPDKRFLHGSAVSFSSPYRHPYREYISASIFDFQNVNVVVYPQKQIEPLASRRTLASSFTIDSKRLLTADGSGSIYIRDLPSCNIIDSLGLPTSLTTALATDFKNRYYISAHEDTTLRLWTPGIPNIFKRILLKSPVTTIAVSPDSVHFATAHTDGTVALWNIDSLANRAPSDTVFTNVAEENPFNNTLLTAEPNPFKNSTTIRFSLEKTLKIKLAVTDVLGREVAVLKDGFMEMGEQNVVFKNENLPNGTYFITLSGDGLLKTIPVNIAR